LDVIESIENQNSKINKLCLDIIKVYGVDDT
jgi:hypothetical protein